MNPSQIGSGSVWTPEEGAEVDGSVEICCCVHVERLPQNRLLCHENTFFASVLQMCHMGIHLLLTSSDMDMWDGSYSGMMWSCYLCNGGRTVNAEQKLYSIKCVAFHTFPCEHLQVWSNGHLPARRLPITRTQDAVVGLGEFEIWLGMKTSFIRIFIPKKIRIAGTLWPWLTGCDSIPTWYWKQRRGLEPRKSWPYPFSIIFSLLTFPSSTLFPKAFTNSWDQFFLGFQVNLIFYL